MTGRVTRSRASGSRPAAQVKKEPQKSVREDRPVANSSKKRKRDVKTEDDESEDDHVRRGKSTKSQKIKGPSGKDLQAGADLANSIKEDPDAQKAEPASGGKSNAKSKSYGLAPGVTPFPDYPYPTAEECQEVKDILARVHGDRKAPKTIPTPSLNSSGCGEVPSVLDALVRTRLSAATNNQNSSRAFKGLVDKFGTIKSGVGKGSVDWNRVRLAPQKEVFEAIKSGGLADVKSRDIKKILDLVYEENQQRRDNIKKDEKGSEADQENEDPEERKDEVKKADAEVLSLDHLHLLSSEDAFQKLTQYPGIGPKTASCVLLFCMQRPSFAVDTHVFRLTKWLGWVPTEQKAKAMAKAEAKRTGQKMRSATVTREKTYAHLDVKVPDDLKYPLHYLLIQHGKKCGWCSAKAGQAAKVGVCPLAHLMSGKGRNKGLAKNMKDKDDASEADIKEEEDDDEGVQEDGDETDASY